MTPGIELLVYERLATRRREAEQERAAIAALARDGRPRKSPTHAVRFNCYAGQPARVPLGESM
jgi:hypothetical protein